MIGDQSAPPTSFVETQSILTPFSTEQSTLSDTGFDQMPTRNILIGQITIHSFLHRFPVTQVSSNVNISISWTRHKHSASYNIIQASKYKLSTTHANQEYKSTRVRTTGTSGKKAARNKPCTILYLQKPPHHDRRELR